MSSRSAALPADQASSSSSSLSTSTGKRTTHFSSAAADYDSSFSEDNDNDEALEAEERERRWKKARRHDLARKERPSAASKAKAHVSQFNDEVARDEGRRQRQDFLTLNAYDRHKKLVNEYLLYCPGSTQLLQRDTSKDKRDIDVIRENHRFLWNDDGGEKPGSSDTTPLTWGQRLAKRYYEQLYREYCICDLSRYRENKVAMRWRTQAELVSGRGQFVCGAKKCQAAKDLRTWEVNFAYVEHGEKKNALVKVRLCPDCSHRLNYHHKKKELTRRKKKRKKERKKRTKSKRRRRHSSSSSSSATDEDVKESKKKLREEERDKKLEKDASDIWSTPLELEQEKTREEDFSEYLEDLFL